MPSSLCSLLFKEAADEFVKLPRRSRKKAETENLMEQEPTKEKNESTAPADDELVDYNEDEEDHSEDMDSLDPAAQALQVQLPFVFVLFCFVSFSFS